MQVLFILFFGEASIRDAYIHIYSYFLYNSVRNLGLHWKEKLSLRSFKIKIARNVFLNIIYLS